MVNMQSSEKEKETRKNRAPEMPYSHLKLNDHHLTFRPNEGTQYMSENTIYLALQSSDNDQSTFGGLNRPQIKKEFLDENGHGIKTWDRCNPLTIKQEPNIKLEPGIKMEPQEFNNVQQFEGRLVIDLTEDNDNPSAQKRPMPRAELWTAINKRQKTAMTPIEIIDHPVESLFVQDYDSPRSISPSTSDPLLGLDEDHVSGFNEYQEQFQSLQSPSIEQQIEFENRREEELQRRRKVRNDKHFDLTAQAKSEEGSEGDNSSRPALKEQSQSKDSQPKEQTQSELKKPARVKRVVTRVSTAGIQKAKEIGLAQLLLKEGLGKRAKAKEPETEPETETEEAPKARGNRKKPRRPHTLLSNEEIQRIFRRDDGPKNGKDPLPPGFVSTEKNKQKAFREMLASIPVAEQAEARGDISILNEATQTFNPSARSDGKGKWKVRGLVTPLMVNQVLAASWMCKRETSSSKLKSGLLCDVMGFGKTLSTLACIVNRKVPTEPEGPTLIVAPRNLIETWMSQIRQHCDTEAAGTVIAHCSGARVKTNNLVHYLRQCNIVLTTYSDISSSYPNLKLPPDMKTEAAIEMWWNQEYDEKAGVFHQIHWHRIILDEAHIIRNRMTRTSIAVRSLSGNFKWALTGTPLHNSVDELYALFTFIDVPNSHPYEVFMHNYCDGTHHGKNRLINTLRAIIHRKTHESRHMGRPLIELKRFNLKEVKIEFYPAEKQIYSAIAEKFLEKVNSTLMKKQRKCVLTMILKLQMFASHPLTAEDYLKRVCNFNTTLVTRLKAWVKDETSPGNPSPSSKLAKCCIAGKYRTGMPTAPLTSEAQNENLRPRPPGNCAKLVSKFEDRIKDLLRREAYYESDHRTWFCPGCEGLPTRAIITDCQHLYCEDCFDALPDEERNTDGVARSCRVCRIPIRKAAFYGIYDDFDTPPVEAAKSSSLGQEGQQTRPATPETSTAREGQSKRHRTDTGRATTANMRTKTAEDENPDEGDVPCEEEVDKEQDWIAEFGRSMPGAKFDAIRSQVKKWFEEDSTAKIVIFTQYVNSTRILKYLCEDNGWKCSQITGRMANRSREIHLDNFRSDDETKIMISSIKTGGLGLDFSVANKCILVDLWWNEPVQDQAFFRLWRIGQQRDVECIIFMVKGSIDDWMDRTQKRKAKQISEVMSQNVLMDRSTLKELLEMFGEVIDDPTKGFRVLPHKDAAQGASNPARTRASKSTPKATARAIATGKAI
ncbi:uncharacterized protein N7487_007406 [Penicillium crustosum]|uniref:uncharacterized protein n=1 Tax=Penicillium crustosum TaxID=36656 RepID=UPI002394CB00|nr:uncharacterized protein N7487_007406 [Penicillium crustosum]KAJ5401510.1 hypothetical protein N7487_007406 [Penicillium crustosum]